MRVWGAALVVGVFCAGCQVAPHDDSTAIARRLVGMWEYDYGGEQCPGNAILGLRANGTLTSTFGDCEMDSDGFGRYVYGWYVVDDRVCFIELDEEFDDLAKGASPRPALYRRLYEALVREGFVEGRCDWKVLRSSGKEIVIDPDGEAPPHTMRPHRED
jgi:hypothetical protein